MKEKLFLKKLILDGLSEVEKFNKKELNLLFTEHHLSHAASAFFPSNFQTSAILTIDGVGEWTTASIGLGEENVIEFKKEMHFPHSVGLLYSAFTYYLGFKVNSGEYKVMGLAPYGNPNSVDTKRYIEAIKTQLIDIKEDGSIWMDQSYFNYVGGVKMIREKKWEVLFDLPKRESEGELLQNHCDIAYAIQNVTEEIVIKLAKEAKRITGSNNLCLAGGVALNCVANGLLLREKVFENIYIQPAGGDAGGAIGAALSISHQYFNEERVIGSQEDSMNGTYLGPSFSEKEILAMNRKQKAVATNLEFSEITKTTAKALTNEKVVGWFQGRMEFGPRALGNRSILGDASNPEMQQKVNLQIKYREGFRPFAPAVLKEDVQEFFNLEVESPYMLYVASIKDKQRMQLPENYDELTLKKKLSCERSTIQSVTHLDYTARVQTVDKKTNEPFWNLISEFKKLSGKGVLLNTSFNVRGEPIVCTPFDAYRTFMSTEMDLLVINNFIYLKEEQPYNTNKWNVQFSTD